LEGSDRVLLNNAWEACNGTFFERELDKTNQQRQSLDFAHILIHIQWL
jgi:hypothetical protein